MIIFPPSPAVGQTFQRWVWDGVKWAPLAIQISETPTSPISGMLSIGNPGASNTLLFTPYNGDVVRINGTLYRIPPAGISQTGTTAYIDGVPGQTLTTFGVYFVYLFDNAGTLTLDFSLIGHETSTMPGNVGTEIKLGDDSRTLVGLVNTQLATVFVDSIDLRLVRSWFNRLPRSMEASQSWMSGPIPSIDGLTVYYVAFVDEVVLVSGVTWLQTAPLAVPAYVAFKLLVDGVVATSGNGGIPGNQEFWGSLTTPTASVPMSASGVHTVVLNFGVSDSGTFVGGDAYFKGTIL